ncbi:uncharacterized protein Dsk isoform X2 [Cloeon dipterum]|uniref:uncharacterized protein Dsk isoform X2 n=1 Tax=Cloeon dipterum TaxID=197152 RepID=UPI00321FB0E6
MGRTPCHPRSNHLLQSETVTSSAVLCRFWKMRSCVLWLALLCAVVLLALQRGAGAKATPVAAKAAVDSVPRLTRLARQNSQSSSGPGEILIGARIPRRQRPVEGWMLLDQLDALVDEQEKREFDDYGHMRFGKRTQQAAGGFDDYGHMRFGRSGAAAD